jgi:hypothetical protein
VSGSTLTAPISRAVDRAHEEAEKEGDEASGWVELVRSGSLDPAQCAICERRDGPFEEHHVAGRRHGDLTVRACLRCHGRLSERQNGWDPRWQSEARSPALDESFLLRGLSDLCEERSRHFGPEFHRLGKRLRAVYARRARGTI